MAKEKYIITSSCRIDGEHVAKGSILELDLDDKKEGELIATLNRAGRIGQATKKNVDAINAEIKSQEEHERRLEQATRDREEQFRRQRATAVA